MVSAFFCCSELEPSTGGQFDLRKPVMAVPINAIAQITAKNSHRVSEMPLATGRGRGGRTGRRITIGGSPVAGAGSGRASMGVGLATAVSPALVAAVTSGKLQFLQFRFSAGFSAPQSGQRIVSGI